ncbi:hypothetical protein BDN72DRAFT_956733 [Pluteus cervinus]|uniref:Uncharacterized protein n=1 Tax=Pluteus cervinus TaxID=181527 RepID=A0ACD3B4Z3_9AGAR|nr:hypothetical protein BDN72DRAFT_956733 [Pluteus cervinus]
MPFFDLPSELLKSIIVDECEERKDLKSFRQVCHAFNYLARPALFSKIGFTMIENRSKLCLPLLEALATGTTTLHEHVRHLTFTIICTGEPLQYPYLDEESIMKAQRAQTKDYFLKAVDTLKGIRTVKIWFDLSLSDSDWASDGFVKAMTRMVNLTSLSLNSSGFYVPKFDAIRNLQNLSISGNPERLSDHLSTQGAIILSNNPGITSLTIHCTDEWDRNELNTGDSIFRKLPASIEPLQITHLSIRACDPIQMTDNVLRHLKNLRSLIYHPESDEPDDLQENRNEDKELRELNRSRKTLEEWRRTNNNPEPVKIVGHGLPRPVVVEDIERCRPLATAFWNTLWRNKISVESLNVVKPDHATLRYITSLSGLRSLYLGHIDASRRTLVEDLANMFFKDVITNHLETLEELSILSSFSSSWCFGAHNAALFSKCRKLRSLTLTWDAPAGDSEKMLCSMIDVSSKLPLLRTFVVQIAYPRYLRGARCGNPYMSFNRGTRQRVEEFLPKYGPVDIDKHLTEVKIDKSVFRIKEWEDGYRYEPEVPPSSWNASGRRSWS